MSLAAHPTSKIHVLLVDDDDDIRESLSDILKDMKLFSTVVEAKDGSDAFQKFNNQNFDFIITDLSMPKVSGLEFIKNMSSSTSKKMPPIVILSGNVTGIEVQQALKMGVKYVLVKPCTEEQFIEKVEEVAKKEIPFKLIASN